MTMTVTVLDRNASRLRIQINNPDAYPIATVMRTDAAGTRTLRTETGTLPSSATTLVLPDYEYSLEAGDTPTYTVYVGSLAYATVTADPNTDTGLLTLASPTRPTAGLELNDDEGAAGSVLATYEDTRAGQHTVHQVIDRTDPIVILRPGSLRTGTLTISCPDRTTARTVQDALSAGDVLQLRQSDVPDLTMYFVTTSAAVTHAQDVPAAGQPRWSVVAQVTEVAWPTGDVVPVTVWTFDDVAAEYGDFNAVAATFATFADLLERIT